LYFNPKKNNGNNAGKIEEEEMEEKKW